MNAGITGLAIVVIILIFVLIAIFSNWERQNSNDERVHHERLLEELRNQPWDEVDEYD